MTLIQYKEHKFKPHVEKLITRANQLIEQYQAAGYSLTLRQLYYRLVATDPNFENTIQQYKRLSATMSKARYAGLTSWTAINDNHRKHNGVYTEERVEAAVEGIAGHYAPDLWQDQSDYVEIWVEKDALNDVVSKPAKRWKVPYMACKGYLSTTQAWEAAQRFAQARSEGKTCYLLHLGDHDPSGIDMTRDNGDRLDEFWQNVTVKRLALNMDQIEEHNPPPDPAKVTDSRYQRYADEFGDESWELDALEPQVIDDLLDEAIRDHIDDWASYHMRKEETQEGREILRWIGRNSDEVIQWAVDQMNDEE